MKHIIIIAALLAAPAAAPAAAQAPPSETLFKNVRVYDGKAATLSAPTDVLVRGTTIAAIGTTTFTPTATVIEGNGRTLMPGLIDAHWHAVLVRPTAEQAIYGDLGFTNLVAGAEATATLMRGFTSVRDMGGPVFGLKAAIDAGILPGPRIWPSGAMISVTGGHGDFRFISELPRDGAAPLSRGEVIGGSAIADSPDMVRIRVREQLMKGASQIKLTAGGGVSSPHSPLDVSTFTQAELTAAVEAAGNWGTYVAVHAYTPAAIQRAVAAGVKVIEHAHLTDEPTMKLLADKGIWLSTQPFVDDEDASPRQAGSPEAAKKAQVTAGTDRVYTLAKKYGVRLAFGTDILFSAENATRQGAWIGKLTRWFTPAEALRQATGNNGDLLALSGLRSPYPARVGVVETGAAADLLLVDGNPLEDLKILANPDRNFLVIMKDGRIHKNTVPAR